MPVFRGFKEFLHEFLTNKMGVLGAIIVLFFCVVAVFAPFIMTHDLSKFGSPDEILLPPSPEFLLGTNNVGRDVFSQLVIATRVSLVIGLLAAVISVGIGSTVGLAVSYTHLTLPTICSV